jgi:xanthine dehydrogenase accessory factor
MEVSRKVLRRAAELADAGQPFALCTVTTARGSVPGKAGAKMIVERDGTPFGTVGGAGLEEKTKALAAECLAKKKSGHYKFDLAYFRPGALDSLCGGSVEILVEYMGAVPHVLICGGGHVGLEVARLLDQLEYVYSVVDDRPEYAGRARFAHAHGLFPARPEDFFPTADLSLYSHIIILGYSHRVDTDILTHCCQRFGGYVGVISSKLKRKEMFARVKQRGVTDAELARVEAPLGLAIGAETPAEIAVSIVGGIIAHHKGAATSVRVATPSDARAQTDSDDSDSDRPPAPEVRDGEVQQA